MASPPVKKNRVILGLMNFGPDVDWGARITSLPEFTKFLDLLQAQGYNEVDTARQYQRGQQEAFTAAAKWKERGLKLATKIYPVTPGQHSRATLTSMFNESLVALQTTSVPIFYLHAADRSVPFVETLEAVNELHKQGKFETFALSNFTAFEVAEVVVTCKERGWVRPTLYQAMYNALTRMIEPELVVACRRYGLDIVVYNPLAGGLFTGKYSPSSLSSADSSNSLTRETSVGSIYRSKYFKDSYFTALELIQPVVEKNGLTMVETALRWLVHHSALRMENTGRGGETEVNGSGEGTINEEKRGNDGIIIGASSVGQLRTNLLDIEKGPLPKEVVEILDKAWEVIRSAGNSPEYWHLKLEYTYGFDD